MKDYALQRGPSCGACRFFDPEGFCRRRSPGPVHRLENIPVTTEHARWPQVRVTDWCGEFDAAPFSTKAPLS
jgi:hypothetical protein